ncbi:response regulator transcription factor [Corallincola platygyrae]|uniref:Response regulator transcription factor n=1 Tax=Corallincola platygyrae TaxID=1193278 RepID=A0ABW4XSE1_9GAMM
MPLRLLVIEDDQDFSRIVCRRLSREGYECREAANATDALLTARQWRPEYILLDVKLAEQSGLSLISPLRQLLPSSRIVLLTGYASIANAVEAIHAGADDYLAKPADTQTIVAALQGKAKTHSTVDSDQFNAGVDEPKMTPERLEWEHIQQVMKANDGNISKTAEQLGMHRRTLQRKLKKRPVSQ